MMVFFWFLAAGTVLSDLPHLLCYFPRLDVFPPALILGSCAILSTGRGLHPLLGFHPVFCLFARAPVLWVCPWGRSGLPADPVGHGWHSWPVGLVRTDVAGDPGRLGQVDEEEQDRPTRWCSRSEATNQTTRASPASHAPSFTPALAGSAGKSRRAA